MGISLVNVNKSVRNWGFIQNSIIKNFIFCAVQTTIHTRGRSRAAATSKMERFVIIVNGWKPLTIITKRSILDVAAAVDPSLIPEPRFILSMKVYSVCLIISCIKQQVGCLQPQCLYKVIQLVKITKRSSSFLQVFYKISVLIKFR